MSRVRLLLYWAIPLLIAVFLAIQLVPYGHNHTNPAVRREPRWANAETRALTVRACFDCHSNQTTWPWYSNVAPVSWLVQRDVEDGRSQLNFSDWGHSDSGSGDAAEAVRGGSMPPWYYVVLHPKAKLSSAEKSALLQGLARTH
jgi:hypothetical protein